MFPNSNTEMYCLHQQLIRRLMLQPGWSETNKINQCQLASAREAHMLLHTSLLYLKIANVYLNFSILVNNTAVLQRVQALATLRKPPSTHARQMVSPIYINRWRAQQTVLLLSAARCPCWGKASGCCPLGDFGPWEQHSRGGKCNCSGRSGKEMLWWSSKPNIREEQQLGGVQWAS